MHCETWPRVNKAQAGQLGCRSYSLARSALHPRRARRRCGSNVSSTWNLVSSSQFGMAGVKIMQSPSPAGKYRGRLFCVSKPLAQVEPLVLLKVKTSALLRRLQPSRLRGPPAKLCFEPSCLGSCCKLFHPLPYSVFKPCWPLRVSLL